MAFNQYNWHEFATIEPVPEVITNALTQTQPLRASNGEKYTQDANGQWQTPGWVYGTNLAEGSIVEELNRTRQSQQAGVQELTSMADIARANPTPTEYGLRSQVVDAYRSAGIVRSAEEIDDAVAAVAQDHARAVPDFGTFMLQVQRMARWPHWPGKMTSACRSPASPRHRRLPRHTCSARLRSSSPRMPCRARQLHLSPHRVHRRHTPPGLPRSTTLT